MVSVMATTDHGTAPAHIAIIMDGNGRWAKSQGLSKAEGHRQGAEAVRNVVESASEMGIAYLTLFGFSSENWKRPEREVEDLMVLLQFYLRSEIINLQKKNIRFLMIGDRTRLPSEVVELIKRTEYETNSNTGLTLILALSYGGRQEIVSAVKRICDQVIRGEIDVDKVNVENFSSYLWTIYIPDPDLVIRTSGEQRISNFLLWQIAYSEFVFVDVLWPDFGADQLKEAIQEFQSRDRRYGASNNRT